MASLNHLARLLGDDFDGLIHVDSRASLDGLALAAQSRFKLARKRFPIFWGGFNMIEAELSLIEEAIELFPESDRLILISGDTLPTLAPPQLAVFFSDLNVEFMWRGEIADDPSLAGASWQDATERHGNWLPWRLHNQVMWDDELTHPREIETTERRFGVDRPTALQFKTSAQRLVNSVLADLPPREKLFPKFYFGQQWWALTKNCAEALLTSPDLPRHKRFFKYMSVPDEHFFHTIIGNHPVFAEKASGDAIMHVAHPNVEDIRALPLKPEDLAFSSHRRPFVRKYQPEYATEIAGVIESGLYFRELVQSA